MFKVSPQRRALHSCPSRRCYCVKVLVIFNYLILFSETLTWLQWNLLLLGGALFDCDPAGPIPRLGKRFTSWLLSPNTSLILGLRLHLNLETNTHNALSIDLGELTMLLQQMLIYLEVAGTYSNLLCDILEIGSSHLVLVSNINTACEALGGHSVLFTNYFRF